MLAGFLLLPIFSYSTLTAPSGKFTVAIHSGAGFNNRAAITLEKEIEIKKGLIDSLTAAYKILKNGGSDLDATEAAVVLMEDNPIFNAGKGAKINKNFEVELDASIMDGSTLQCGAVGAVKKTKNPIKAARLIMETTNHIFLIGSGADRYSRKKGLDMVMNSYFFTPERIHEWYEAQKKEHPVGKMGTVGCVALDTKANLAAATSTGGITYKMKGRVGDSSIIGAGNYANNESCAVSCTGIGEIMMKHLIAYDVHARMKYKGLSLQEAGQEIIDKLEPEAGGFISVDKEGNVFMPFNSGGMARGYVKEDGKAKVMIFHEGEDLTGTDYDLE